MRSICGNQSIAHHSDALVSSDVFVKLSQHTSTEISDFTVFTIVFMTFYFHFQSLKHHFSHIVLNTQAYASIPLAKYSQNTISQKTMEAKTFNISLLKLFETLFNDQPLQPQVNFIFSFLIAITITTFFLFVTAPIWPKEAGPENIFFLSFILFLSSFGLFKFIINIETPSLIWIILLSLASSIYAVVRTSKCDENRVCLYHPNGSPDNFSEFDYTWILIALAIFFVHKSIFIFYIFKNGTEFLLPLRSFGILSFILFYFSMILTTFLSSPEIRNNQLIPCTSKGAFVGQFIYWPFFLMFIFYIDRGTYVFQNETNNTFISIEVFTFVASLLFFFVPIYTIYNWQNNPDTSITRRTCTLKQPTITIDTESSRCCDKQHITTHSRIFDVHLHTLGENNHELDPTELVFKLKDESGTVVATQENGKIKIVTQNPDLSTDTSVYLFINNTVGNNQIEMSAGLAAFPSGSTTQRYTLEVQYMSASFFSMFSRFTQSQKLSQVFEFVNTNAPNEDNSIHTTFIESLVQCTGNETATNIILYNRSGESDDTQGTLSNPLVIYGTHNMTGVLWGGLWGAVFGGAITFLVIGFLKRKIPPPTGEKPKEASRTLGFIIGGPIEKLMGFIFGFLSGSIAGYINEQILSEKKKKKVFFEYIDQNNYPVARVDGNENNIQIDKSNFEWLKCTESQITDGNECTQDSTEETPDITYNPPKHCNTLAQCEIDFTQKNNKNEKGIYQLAIQFNTHTKEIYFKREKSPNPIFFTQDSIYFWILFMIFFILLFLIILYISYFTKTSENFTKRTSELLYKVVSSRKKKTRDVRSHEGTPSKLMRRHDRAHTTTSLVDSARKSLVDRATKMFSRVTRSNAPAVPAPAAAPAAAGGIENKR